MVGKQICCKYWYQSMPRAEHQNVPTNRLDMVTEWDPAQHKVKSRESIPSARWVAGQHLAIDLKSNWSHRCTRSAVPWSSQGAGS